MAVAPQAQLDLAGQAGDQAGRVQAGDQTGVVFREVVFQVVVVPAAFREDSRARDQAAVAVVDTEM